MASSVFSICGLAWFACLHLYSNLHYNNVYLPKTKLEFRIWEIYFSKKCHGIGKAGSLVLCPLANLGKGGQRGEDAGREGS